jgi:hypothetical protein
VLAPGFARIIVGLEPELELRIATEESGEFVCRQARDTALPLQDLGDGNLRHPETFGEPIDPLPQTT